MPRCFVPADILLPQQGTPLDPWACIAVDQFTSQPRYWQKAEERAEGKPSTLHLVLPEAYLGTAQEEQRLAGIRAAMRQYQAEILTRHVHGYVYVERVQMDGTIRQGLVGAVDLESYSYEKGAKPAIRPSEGTVVSRIPPRLKVRRGASLETPHIMMLADDAAETLIEPIGDVKRSLPLLYQGDLMLGGGRLRGWAVEDPALLAQINTALTALGDPDAFAARWGLGVAAPTMTLAVGDGNHSLATAKAYWEELKPTLTPAQQKNHPARWCLAEVCNVHSPAIEIEPIHRVVFGADAGTLRTALAAWLPAQGAALAPADTAAQHFTLVGNGGSETLGVANPPHPLTVGTIEQFLTDFTAAHPGVTVDYIHGAETAKGMAGENAAALLLPDFDKDDLFRGVVLGGVLPRKTFSMGHAEEKRYYNECRSLLPTAAVPQDEKEGGDFNHA